MQARGTFGFEQQSPVALSQVRAHSGVTKQLARPALARPLGPGPRVQQLQRLLLFAREGLRPGRGRGRRLRFGLGALFLRRQPPKYQAEIRPLRRAPGDQASLRLSGGHEHPHPQGSPTVFLSLQAHVIAEALVDGTGRYDLGLVLIFSPGIRALPSGHPLAYMHLSILFPRAHGINVQTHAGGYETALCIQM